MSTQQLMFNKKIFKNIKKKIYDIKSYKNEEFDDEDDNLNKIMIFKNLDFIKWEIILNTKLAKLSEKYKNSHYNDFYVTEQNLIFKEGSNIQLPQVAGGLENILEYSFSYNVDELNIDKKIENSLKTILRYVYNLQIENNCYKKKNNNFNIIYDDIGSSYEGEGNIEEFINI